MKTTILAAALAVLVSGPVFAAVPGSATPGNATGAISVAFKAEPVKAQPPSAQKPTEQASVPTQYVGPFEVRNGLLPNQIAPNAFNYG